MAKVMNSSIEIKIVDLGGHEFTATDTEEAKVGSLAFQLFSHHETVEIKEENKTTYIPFHAICHVEVTKTSSEEEVEDDTCKEIDWCCKDSASDTPDEPVEP